jgi:ComEC/Rec2-related protein
MIHLRSLLNSRWSFIVLRLPYSMWYAAFFILGICWQAHYISIYATITAAVSMLIFTQHLHNNFLRISTVSLLFTLGAWRFLDYHTKLHHQLAQLCEKPLFLKGEVIDASTQIPNTVSLKILSMQHASTKETLECVPSTIQLILQKNHPIVTPGDILEVQRIWFIKPSQQNLISLQRKDILARGYVSAEQKIAITPGKISLTSQCSKTKNHLVSTIYQTLSRATATLFSSIFLGVAPPHSDFMQKLRATFSWWGISHYLARSGLHLALIVYILHAFLCTVPIPYRLKQIIALLGIALYTALSWPSISFLRATMMICCSLICILINAPSNNLHLLMCTTIAVLFYNPLYLSCLEFQLSFFLTLGLALIQHADLIAKK